MNIGLTLKDFHRRKSFQKTISTVIQQSKIENRKQNIENRKLLFKVWQRSVNDLKFKYKQQKWKISETKIAFQFIEQRFKI